MLKIEGLMMKFERWALLPLVAISLVICFAALPVSAQSYKAEKVTLAPPQELSPAVRDVLGGDALQVTGPSGLLCEVWVRKIVPTAPLPVQDKEIAFGQIAEGTLIGAIRFPSSAVDYRGTGVKPGVYTLLYPLIPEDS